MKKLSLRVLLLLLCGFWFFASAGSAYDFENNQFVFVGNVTRQDSQTGGYVINDSGQDYTLSSAQLKDFKNLDSILAKAVKSEDKSVRFSGVWTMVNDKKELDPANLKAEIINDAKDCPEKTFSRHTITGTFLGTDCGDFCYTTVKDNDGKEITMYGDTEEIFGTKPGIRVTVDYEVAQAWLDTGDWGMCVVSEFFVSGKEVK